MIEFDDIETSVANFYIPTIHCSSCIWVLENLHKLNKGVKVALVNFPKKEVRITFRKSEITLQEVVELIASIGYEPYISLDNADVLDKKIDKLAKLIFESNHFIAFTGAGISTACGIPDFRSGVNTVLKTGPGAW